MYQTRMVLWDIFVNATQDELEKYYKWREMSRS